MTRQVRGRLRITIRLSIARLLLEIGWLPFIARAGAPVLSVSIHSPTSAEIMQTIKVASNSLVRSGSPSLVLNVWLTNCHMAWRNGEHILLAHASHNVERNPSQMDLLHFAVGSCFVIKGTLQTSDACIRGACTLFMSFTMALSYASQRPCCGLLKVYARVALVSSYM